MGARRDRLLWELRVVAILLSVSLSLYLVHFFCFRDLRHIWLWSFTNLAFLPISALVVTLLINRVLSARDKALRLDKLNMLIGVFFSSIGNEFLLQFSDWDSDAQYLHDHFGAPKRWAKLEHKNSSALLAKHPFSVTVTRAQLVELKKYLDPRINSMIRLLENPNLLEHENFTQLLHAAFHLAEELSYRDNIETIPDADLRHLAGDVERVYALLVREWVYYMIFLRRAFPYLFSLAIRTNPFDRSASVIIL